MGMNKMKAERDGAAAPGEREVEVFGVTYDRYMLLQLHKALVRDLGVETVVEMPSHGAKAAGSLYSIGFGLTGARVTLVNPEPEMMGEWETLGISDRVETVSGVDVNRTPFATGQFDLAWNFVTWTELADPEGYLQEMRRISSGHVLFVTCNNLQPGYPWHRLLHRIYGFPWTHGEVRYNHLAKVMRMFRQAGLRVAEYGTIDTPGWPDPSGPRDVRLHRRYGTTGQRPPAAVPDWEVPILRYARTGRFPLWMRMLGIWDMAFRKGIFKLPLSHLFYVLGRTA
jgi:Methyltransferase domain